MADAPVTPTELAEMTTAAQAVPNCPFARMVLRLIPEIGRSDREHTSGFLHDSTCPTCNNHRLAVRIGRH